MEVLYPDGSFKSSNKEMPFLPRSKQVQSCGAVVVANSWMVSFGCLSSSATAAAKVVLQHIGWYDTNRNVERLQRVQ